MHFLFKIITYSIRVLIMFEYNSYSVFPIKINAFSLPCDPLVSTPTLHLFIAMIILFYLVDSLVNTIFSFSVESYCEILSKSSVERPTIFIHLSLLKIGGMKHQRVHPQNPVSVTKPFMFMNKKNCYLRNQVILVPTQLQEMSLETKRST